MRNEEIDCLPISLEVNVITLTVSDIIRFFSSEEKSLN